MKLLSVHEDYSIARALGITVTKLKIDLPNYQPRGSITKQEEYIP